MQFNENDESQWYLSVNGKKKGPISSTSLKEMADSGILSREALLWKDGMVSWILAGNIPTLFNSPPSLSTLPSRGRVDNKKEKEQVTGELMISPFITRRLPNTVKAALKKMSDDEQQMFQQEFRKKQKHSSLMIVIAIFFPIQHFLLGKTGLGICMWLTGGGCMVWWFIEVLMTPGRVKDYNDELATKIVTDIKIMNS